MKQLDARETIDAAMTEKEHMAQVKRQPLKTLGGVSIIPSIHSGRRQVSPISHWYARLA